jgi:hypothetical protein
MMKKYRVMLEGRNFLIAMDGKVGKFGFYQTFFIDAHSPAEAENAAVQKVRANSDLKTTVRNPKDDPPMVYLEEIEEIQEFPKDSHLVTGRGWYSEDEEEETSNKASDATSEPAPGADSSAHQG